MRTTFVKLAVMASSLLVKEVFAAPVQERAIYLDTDVILVTEEVTVSELPDGSFQTGAPVALGTSTVDGTPVLFTPSSSISIPVSSAVKIAATTSSAASVSSSAALFIQATPSPQIEKPSTTSTTPKAIPTTSAAPVIPPTTLSTKASTTPVAVPTTSTSSAPAPTKPVSSSKKRGLAYNDASALSGFVNSLSQVSWAYNWGSSTPPIASGLEYTPMLWGLASDHTSGWSALATKAIASGSTALLGFNEPDYSGQSNLQPSEAAAGWKTHMQPFAGKATLVSPAVTNGGAPMGLTWLSNFLSACSDCTVDAVAVHWYNGGDAKAFKEYIQQAYTAGGNRPLWITEFQASGSADQQKAFLQQVIPFLDSTPMVARYAYFWANPGSLLDSGSILSSLGNTFASFVS